ncbi:TlpA disulfide reductase family protein [Marinilabiliaceae bacterium ANBcel2]|nr:TlpA disulfide reductase family protein [Marinilabiliaceae bacterium ANBcel2]
MKKTAVLILTGLLIGLSSLTDKAYVNNIPEIEVENIMKRVSHPSDTIFVLNFWATWCQPCVKEIPEFNKLPDNYKNRPVKTIMASLDFPNQKESRVVPFLENNIVENEVVITITPRGGEWIEETEKEWSGAIPATIIFYNNNRTFYEGERNYEQLIDMIDSLL